MGGAFVAEVTGVSTARDYLTADRTLLGATTWADEPSPRIVQVLAV